MLPTYHPTKAEKTQGTSLLLWVIWENESYYYPITNVFYFDFICLGLKLLFKQYNLPHSMFGEGMFGYLVSGMETSTL